MKVFVEPFQFLGWFWDAENGVKKTPPSNVVAVSETKRKLYQNIAYINYGKTPICQYANNTESVCLAALVKPVYIRSKSSLLQTQIDSSFVKLGIFNLFHEMIFRGNGVSDLKTLDAEIEIIPVQMTSVLTSLAFDIRNNFVQNVVPSSSHYPNINQLAPVCYSLGYEVKQINLDLQLNRSYKVVAGWKKDDTTGIIKMVSNGQDITSTFTSAQNKIGFLQTTPVSQFDLEFKDLSTTTGARLSSNYKIFTDPNRPELNNTSMLDSLGYETPKVLPELPALKLKSADCALPVNSLTGFRKGDGTQENPFIICGYSELYNLSQYKNNLSLTVYGILKDNIDLSSVNTILQPNGVVTYLPITRTKINLDGDGYRVTNAYYSDREATFSMFNFGSVKNLIFFQNRITAKTIIQIYNSNLDTVENVYSYDNIFEAQEFRGIADNVIRGFSKNQIQFKINAFGIASINAIASFSQDEIRFVGVEGSALELAGVARNAIFSGSSSNLKNGGMIGGVAIEYCYKCFSKVIITAVNANVIGGIIAKSITGLGNIEIGESQAQITAIGNTIVGGLIGSADYSSLLTGSLIEELNINIKVKVGYGYIHIMNSKFTGKIISSYIAGGLIGKESFFSPPIFTNNTMTGELSGVNAKIGSYVGQINTSCNTERRQLKIRSNNITGSYSPVGDYYGAVGGDLVGY